MRFAYRRPSSLTWPLAALLCLALWACGGDDDTGDDGGNDGGGDGTSIDASPTTPDAGAEPDASKDDPDAGGKVCGGFAGAECADDEYCDYQDDSCGSADGAGVCMPRPDACIPEGPSVCGCDGEVYANRCTAAQAGTDVAQFSICQV